MPMSMNKVIHAAVRRDLNRLDVALDTFPAGDVSRAAELERGYAFLQAQLTHHHEDEDRLIWPALDELGVDRLLLDEMESEHHAMSEALAETATTMVAFTRKPDAASAQEALASVRRTRTVVDRHLDHEEQELEPALAQHLESPEWKSVEKQLRKQPIGDAGVFLAWIQDGMESDARTYLRSTIPPPVLAIVPALFGRSYKRDVAPVWRR
jgi:hemerythrin-like domain-containing protein